MKKFKLNRKTEIIAGLILLVIAAGYLFHIRSATAGKKKPVSGDKIKTVRVDRGSFWSKIYARGLVLPEPTAKVYAPSNGRIEEIDVKVGNGVAKGEALAWMSDDARIALINRAKDVIGRALGSGDEQEVAQARTKMWYALKEHNKLPIVSSGAGDVISCLAQPDQYVSSATLLFQLSDRMAVYGIIGRTDAEKISAGLEGRIQLKNFPDREYSGSIHAITEKETLLNGLTGYMLTIHPNEILPAMEKGMEVTVEFEVPEKENVLVLPLGAVKKIKERDIVFLPGRKKPRVIKTGLRDGKYVEIVAGLIDNERVLFGESK